MSDSADFDPNAVLATALQALADEDVATALALTETLAAACPDSPQALYLRAAAVMAHGGAEAAEPALEQARLAHALSLMQDEGVDVARMAADGPYALGIARRFYNRFWMGPSIVAGGCAVGSTAVDQAEALLVLAQALQFQGRSEEAQRTFRGVLLRRPAPYVHSFILYCLLFVKDGVRRQAEEAHRWQARWARGVTPANPVFHVERRADRPLRIGYQGPFLERQVRHFVPPLLDHHDRSKFEVFVYVEDAAREAPVRDATMRSYKHLPYLEHAEMIREDRIDVLVDFHGHASGARPVVMARKPAPVQVSWLNWIPTTGIASMDYAIHADDMKAGEDARLFSETIWEVGPIIAPFRYDASAGTSPAPALERGYVTFGAFHHPAKITEETLAAWARILRAAPAARLHFKYSSYQDPVLQMETMTRFMAHGVAPDRIEFGGHDKGEAYEAAFAHIDVHLDSSPYPGGTTTMEALSRGVPVLTLRGQNFYARIGTQAIDALAMGELIAETWDDYVAKAVAFTEDLAGLSALRARVRPALDASIYRDEPAFTRMMEKAYVGMFEAWLARELAKAA